MTISCIMLTYGRNGNLAEAVACFLAQTYEPRELVIFNSLPEQQIVCEHPMIRVVNCTERPKSLGETRNAAIAASSGEWIVTADDDDFALSHHLTNFAGHITDDVHWLWQPTQYFVSQGKIKSITKGTMNVVAFTRKAFDAIGGYAPMNSGEDRNFVGRLTTQFSGVKIPPDNFNPSFLYCWGQGNIYHISGEGDDRKGKATAWERSGKDMAHKLKRGVVKCGRIEIVPALKQDYEAMAAKFSNSSPVSSPVVSANKKDGCCVVLLGRFGDIINILPVLRHIAETYAKPHLVISREFLSLLNGVSYVEPYPVDFPYDQLLPAIKLAEKLFKHVIVAQVWGKGMNSERKTEAYNLESWAKAGFAHKF